jgi:hypothetical protein
MMPHVGRRGFAFFKEGQSSKGFAPQITQTMWWKKKMAAAEC